MSATLIALVTLAPGSGVSSLENGCVVIDDPAHWRQRAEEIRMRAEEMKDLQARTTMLRIADECDRLARRAEERLANNPAAPGVT